MLRIRHDPSMVEEGETELGGGGSKMEKKPQSEMGEKRLCDKGSDKVS